MRLPGHLTIFLLRRRMRLRWTHLTRNLSLRRDYTTPRHRIRAKYNHHNHLRRLATESGEMSGL